ncbi:MAG: putative toxin-antitoxin system toxin component, PIN family, partial [Pseudomonadota bacterium]
SALLWRGTPYRLLATIQQQPGFHLYSSTALLEELADVLTRPSPGKRLTAIGRTSHEVLADYLEAVELVSPTTVPRVIPNDPDDDHVIAAAIAARADWIVSGDADLLNLGGHEGILIVPATRALQLIDG